MTDTQRPLAVVTGASSGIGYELAVQCARHGFDLVIAADRPLEPVLGTLLAYRARVETVECDLATLEGVDRVVAAVGGRPVEALLANAGEGLGNAFLDQPFERLRHVLDTNVTGTLYLLHRLVQPMRERGHGRVLVTGSIAGFMPGTFSAVYNASKAFLDSFAQALRAELDGSGVTVTCLMPGATDTEFFRRAGLEGTRLAAQQKDDPAMVARLGIEALLLGEPGVITGLRNKLQVAAALVSPSPAIAALHGRLAAPGSAQRQERASAERRARRAAGDEQRRQGRARPAGEANTTGRWDATPGAADDAPPAPPADPADPAEIMPATEAAPAARSRRGSRGTTTRTANRPGGSETGG